MFGAGNETYKTFSKNSMYKLAANGPLSLTYFVLCVGQQHLINAP